MGVDVDEPGRDVSPLRVDDLPLSLQVAANLRNATVLDNDVADIAVQPVDR